jgi:nanoRNase/pAp phosphatase (c-di-AMP/oligoRNAs hydrolase)
MSQVKAEGKSFLKKYSVERIIVDSDFDGVICGAMLRIVFPEAEILQSKASEIQEGKIDHLINKKTLLADLRYSPLSGYYFDHHESNFPKSDFIGAWSPEPSAAQVIYSYFEDAGDFSNFTPLLDDINRFDSGRITLDEFNNPNETFKLALVINREDTYFNLWLIELLAKFPLTKVTNHPYVKSRIDRFLQNRDKMAEYIEKNSKITGEIVIVNLINYDLKEKMTSYIYNAVFPQTKVVVVIKPHEEKGKFKIRLYRNNFFDNGNELNLLEIAKEMSPDTAGGHKGACGFNTSEDLDEARLINLINKQLNKPHS